MDDFMRYVILNTMSYVEIAGAIAFLLGVLSLIIFIARETASAIAIKPTIINKIEFLGLSAWTGALLAASVIIISICVYSVKYFIPYHTASTKDISMSDYTMSDVEKSLNMPIKKGCIGYAIANNPIFPDGVTADSLDILNPKNNQYLEQIEIEATDIDNGVTFYKSPMLYPGESITHITLDTALPAGSHACKEYLRFYDPTTKSLIREITLPVWVISQK